jgi:hypothetical protein
MEISLKENAMKEVFVVNRHSLMYNETYLDSIFTNEENAKSRCDRLNSMKNELGFEYTYNSEYIYDNEEEITEFSRSKQ